MSASPFCAASRALRAAISASSALATIVGGASTTLLSLGVWERPWDGVVPDAVSSPDVVPIPVFLAHPPRTSIPRRPATTTKYSDLLALFFMGIFPFLSVELVTVRRNDVSWRSPAVEHSRQRPCRVIIECSIGCQPLQARPIGVNHIDIALPVARGAKRHVPTVRRPGRR